MDRRVLLFGGSRSHGGGRSGGGGGGGGGSCAHQRVEKGEKRVDDVLWILGCLVVVVVVAATLGGNECEDVTDLNNIRYQQAKLSPH